MTTHIRPVAAVLLGLLLAGCGQEAEQAAQPVERKERVVAVAVHKLQPEDWQGTIRSYGVVEALEEVGVAAELSGTVSAVHVDEGDRVEAGQLLLELDAHKRELALEQAGQAVQRAQAALQEARAKLKRRRNLAAKESISEEVLDSAQRSVDASNAAYQQSLAAQRLAERELADTRIYSPTAGLVDVQAVEAGEPVQAGATLVILQAVQGLRVHTWISEADIAPLSAGGKATVSASGLPGREFTATVE